MAKKYLSYDRLQEYDELIKAEIANGDESTINSVQTQIDNLDSDIQNHEHDYLPLTGGTVTGDTIFTNSVKMGDATFSYDADLGSVILSFPTTTVVDDNTETEGE